MVQMPNDLRAALDAALTAANHSRAETSGSPKEALAHFAVLTDTLQAALNAIDERQPVDKVALSGISKWAADWIPNIEDPLLDRLDEVVLRLG